jgi:type IV secretory pathway TraG/TraD family ATPase VirD4
MTTRDDDLHVRPGRIGDTRAPTRRARSFVGQVMRAVRKAGHTGPGFGGAARGSTRSRFGRGRAAAAQAALRSPSRRVVIKARVVRHQGTRFRSASLAAHIGYQPQLGQPIDVWAGVPVYPPPAFFLWWYWYDACAPRVFYEGAGIAAAGGFAAIGIAIGMSVWRAREARDVTTYGSARWATEREVRDAGLLAPDGVVLGWFAQRYLRHDAPEHVLCFAPTRSGKGVGLVVPTLLTWPGSAI